MLIRACARGAAPLGAWRMGVRRLSTLPPHTFLPMPALSPTMTQGNLAVWKKAEGDEICAGDVIAEVETDKATVDYEAVDEGFLAKILVSAGSVRGHPPHPPRSPPPPPPPPPLVPSCLSRSTAFA
jgi:hypothetical protein